MVGLLQQGMQPEQGAMPPQQPAAGQQLPQQSQPPQQPPQGQQGDPSVDMTEDGVQQRDMLVDAMLENLYGPLLDKAEKLMQQTADQPIMFVEHITANLMVAAWQRLSEDGKTASPGVMVQAGMMVAQAVGEMLIEAGILQPDEAEVIETGFMAAMARFGKSTKDAMPQKQRKRYAEILGAMSDAKDQAQGGAPKQPQEAPMPQGQPAMAGGMQ